MTLEVEQLLFRRRHAAQILSISTGTLDGLAKQKQINPIYVGKIPMYSKEELRRFVASRAGASK